MLRLFGSILLALSGAALAASIKLSGAKFDCQGVEPATLAAITSDRANPCQRVNQLAAVGKASFLERQQLVQGCTCNLLEQETVWKNLMSPKVELLFDTVQSIVEPRESGCDEVAFLDLIGDLLFDRDGKVWMRDEIVKRIEEEEQQQEQGREEAGAELREFCRDYVPDFGPFVAFIRNMAKLNRNERLVHETSTYNSNLFKEMVAHYACELFVADL